MRDVTEVDDHDVAVMLNRIAGNAEMLFTQLAQAIPPLYRAALIDAFEHGVRTGVERERARAAAEQASHYPAEQSTAGSSDVTQPWMQPVREHGTEYMPLLAQPIPGVGPSERTHVLPKRVPSEPDVPAPSGARIGAWATHHTADEV